MTVTESQLAAKRAQLAADAAEVDRLISTAVATKSYTGLGALEARIDQLAADRAELDRQDAVSKAHAAHPLAQLGMSAADYAAPNFAPDGGNTKRLTFSGTTAKNLASQIDTKALAASGSVVTPVEFKPDPISLGKPAFGLLT